MFLIGFDSAAGYYPFDTNTSTSSYTKVEVENVIVDDLAIDAGYKNFTTEKGEWQSNTVLLATFDNTLEAGNLSMGEMEVNTLRFKKRKKGTMEWLLIEELPYDKAKLYYEVRDRLARSNIEYEYGIVPVSGETEGEMIKASIVALYEGLWVVDANNSVNIFCEVDYGTIKHNTNSNVYEMLDNRYPIVINGELDYVSGNISGRLVSNESLRENKMVYNAEYDFKTYVFEFFKNGKPKIMKNDKGRYYLINISDVQEKPYDLDDASVTVSFNWVEIGDAEDLNTLITCDLLPEKLKDV